jgi:hypothetical protein
MRPVSNGLIPLSMFVPCIVFPQLQKQLPQDREHYALQAIGNNPRLQPSAKQPQPAILTNDSLGSLGIRNSCVVDLPVRLHNTQRVRNRVRHNRGTETDESCAEQPPPDMLLVRLGNDIGEEVVSREPWVMACECCGSSGESTPPETANAISSNAVAKQYPSPRALRLQCGLERVDGRENHPECCGA